MNAVPTRTTIAKSEARAPHGMVATKDVHATRAGVQMLEMGGNAVDAAVAACFAVGVVEPASSGIGGGGYLVYQVGERGGVVGFPMKGPLAARPDMYELSGEASVGNFGWAGVMGDENLDGPRSIAVPGAVAGLCEAHKLLGRLPLRDVAAPAVSLARDGHSPGWHNVYALGLMAPRLFEFDELRGIFMPGGNLPTGDATSPAILRQPDLADVLEAIGRDGPGAFYAGDVARAITSDIRESGGVVSERDLAEYRPFVWEPGLELGYSGHTVRVPPFACAGTTSAMTLRLLDGFDMGSMGHNSADALHAYIYAARLAYADRYEYMADPAFVDVPWDGLVSDGYADRRRGLIDALRMGAVEPGDPWAFDGGAQGERLPASVPALGLRDDAPVRDGRRRQRGVAHQHADGRVRVGVRAEGHGRGDEQRHDVVRPDPGPGELDHAGQVPAQQHDAGAGAGAGRGADGGWRVGRAAHNELRHPAHIEGRGLRHGPQEAIDSPRVDCSLAVTSVDPRMDGGVVAELEGRGHRIYVIGDDHVQGGFAGFASPVAIVRDAEAGFRAGVDTFHSAYAEGV